MYRPYSKITNTPEANDKATRIMNGIDTWCSFYRANPQRFVSEYLGIELRLFQQMLIFMMNISTNFIYLAARGQGKSYLIAIFCCIRCILYPETQIIVASGTRGQALEIIEKIINIFKPKSPNLANEISEFNTSPTNGFIKFKNSSMIKIIASNQNARHNRANIVILDEFRMIDKDVINSVIKRFLTARREPKFLQKPEYANYPKEKNQRFYLSSCWLKSHWSWNFVQDYAVNILDDTKDYFICSLPYQLSIAEDLLYKSDLEDEMSESTFDEINFSMECGALWWGENENAFFSYESLVNARKNNFALYPNDLYKSFSNKVLKPFEKQPNEIRLLSVDIAAMTSRKNKNDATAIFIIQLLPTKDGQYIRNVLYSEVYEGGHTETQSLIIRKLFDQMQCDYIVIDSNGVGLGVYDGLVKDIVDAETGEFYSALNCINDPEMASRYKGNSLTPPKVIYSIKANAGFNSKCAWALRDCLSRNKMRLLITEQEFRRQMGNVKAYTELSVDDKLTLEMPYIQTTLLVNELIELECTTNGTDIKIKEQYDKRKDRYSALSYGNYVANELEMKLHKRKNNTGDKTVFDMRKPEVKRKRVW